jgi:CDP-diacylglycerol--serine O-phosphatidyltransferase
MEAIKKALPSVFTSLNLIAGCISIVFCISHKDLTIAGYFILLAAFFDFVDGFVARMVNHISDFGKELDSLADVVSFGVAPAMIIFYLISLSYVKTSPGSDFDSYHPAPMQGIIMVSAFLVAAFSALRLAKFNLDPGQVKNFKGLPVPANALFFAALGFTAENSQAIPGGEMVFNRIFLLAVIAISCFLLVSNIGMFSLKFTTYGVRSNYLRYIFLLLSVLMLIVFGLPALAPVIILYILMSQINNWFVKMV